MRPCETYSKLGLVSIHDTLGQTHLTASVHLLLSIVPFKNFLVNKEYSKYEIKPTVVTFLENLAKSMWSRNSGSLEPRGLLKYLARKAKSNRCQTGASMIRRIMMELETKVTEFSNGANPTFDKLFGIPLRQYYLCNGCKQRRVDAGNVTYLTIKGD
jgi:hypothetical protein